LESNKELGHKSSDRLFYCELHEVEFSSFERLQLHLANSPVHRDSSQNKRVQYILQHFEERTGTATSITVSTKGELSARSLKASVECALLSETFQKVVIAAEAADSPPRRIMDDPAIFDHSDSEPQW
jgi:hypothetical protein